MAEFHSLSKVLAFVGRTRGHGVPERVAIQRAARRFGIDREVLRAFLRGSK
jgi:hypothetical protein